MVGSVNSGTLDDFSVVHEECDALSLCRHQNLERAFGWCAFEGHHWILVRETCRFELSQNISLQVDSPKKAIFKYNNNSFSENSHRDSVPLEDLRIILLSAEIWNRPSEAGVADLCQRHYNVCLVHSQQFIEQL